MRGHRSISSALGLVALAAAGPLMGQQNATGAAASLDSLLNIQISAASRYEQVSREAPASITVLTRDDLERFGFITVAEALESLRGFYGTFDRVHKNLGVRGFSRTADTNKRILLLVDGSPWNDIGNAQASVGNGLVVPMEMVERIEVVRGPGSALYGSSAMLAVVNVITRSGHSLSGVTGAVEAGSHGLRGFRVAAGTALPNGIDLAAHATWLDVEGPDVYFPEFLGEPNGGHLSGRDGEHYYGWSLVAKRQGLTASLRGARQYMQDPTAPIGSSFDTDGTFRDMDRVSGILRFEEELTPRISLRAELFAHYSDMALAFAYDAPSPDRVMPTDGPKWGGEVQLRFDATPSDRIVAGVIHQRVDPHIVIEADGVPRLDTEPEVNLVSVFVQNEWQPLADVSLVAGVRADRYTAAGSAVSPRAAMVYHPSSSSSLKLLYGSAFRAPTLLEQFVDEPGVHMANPDLDPERIRQVEAVWERRLGRNFQLAASAFEYRMSDLIALTVSPVDGLFQYRNVDRARSRGIGTEVFGRLPRGTSLFASASWQHAEDENTSDRLPNSPTYLFRVGASTVFPGGVRLGTVVLADGERKTVHGLSTDRYTLVNATLTTPSVGGFTATAAVRNVFDTFYRHPAGAEHRQLGIPQYGRHIRVSVSATF